MALPRPNLLKLAVPALVFLVALLAFAFANRSDTPAPDRARSEGRPGDPRSHAALGEAFVQKARETQDSGFYDRAEREFETALRRDPRDVGGVLGMGTLALNRHDFREGLAHGLRARRLAPELVRPYALVVDAQVELGRYGDARRSLQRMVDLKPNLASYARVSYFRELHGDLAGAKEAMRLAVSAGGGAAENVAYVQTLLGDLELSSGRVAEASEAYGLALDRVPGYVNAGAGLARVEAAEGDLSSALRRQRAVVARSPGADNLLELGELELAAGLAGPARRHLRLALEGEREGLAGGASPDGHSILYEADYGSSARGVLLGRRAYREAPSISTADALGWALTRAGRPDEGLSYARRSLRLGSRNAAFLYHAGMSARAAGRPRLARAYLSRALAVNPRFSALRAPRARRALAALQRR